MQRLGTIANHLLQRTESNIKGPVKTHGEKAQRLKDFCSKQELSEHHVKIISEEEASKYAGILIPAFEKEGELFFLLTQRSAELRSHAGEVCFPGGKTDVGEDSLCASVREAFEEIGIGEVEVVGALPCMLSKHGLVCSPFVAFIPSNYELKTNEREVADVFSVPLSFLLDESNMKIVVYPEGWESYEWTFERPSDGKRFRIWGLTGAMLLYILHFGFGFKPSKMSPKRLKAMYEVRGILK